MLQITMTEHTEDGSDPGVQYVALVDISGPQPECKEMTFTALNGTGLNQRNLPNINFAALAAAFTGQPATPPPAKVNMARTAPAQKATPAPKAAAKVTKPAAKPSKTAKVTEGAEDGKRPYRRMPDDLADVVRQLGRKPVDLMRHYEVPRHTANGWLRKLDAANTAPAKAESVSSEPVEG